MGEMKEVCVRTGDSVVNCAWTAGRDERGCCAAMFASR